MESAGCEIITLGISLTMTSSRHEGRLKTVGDSGGDVRRGIMGVEAHLAA